MWDFLKDCYFAFVEWRRMQGLESYWKRAGHPNPAGAAIEEMHRRIALEKFRDFASARYLADPTLTITEIKLEYYQWVTPDTLKAQAKTRQALETEMAAIAAMTDCFVGEAKAIHAARSAERSRQEIKAFKHSRKAARPSYENRARRGWG